MLLPIGVFAGTNGTLTGKVVDEDGKGIVGATVRVLGTTRGANVLDPKGRYDVVQIPAGEYQVQASFVGMSKVIKTVRISADGVATLNFTLTSDATAVDTIVVTGEKLRTDEKSIQTSMDNEKIQLRGGTSIAVAAQGAGISTSGTGFSVRGGRSSDTQIRVDGVDITDQFSGGAGSAGTGMSPIVSTMMIEEVQVKRGTFSAEYGDAMGGMVNSTVRTGRNDRYNGWLALKSDFGGALNGSQKHSVSLQPKSDGAGYEPVIGGKGAHLNGGQNTRVDVGFMGPLPFLKNSTFSLSTYLDYNKYSGGFEIYDPAGNDFSRLPQDTWVKNITGKMNFNMTDNLSLMVGGSWGMVNQQAIGFGWLYADDPGELVSEMTPANVVNVPENIAKINVWNVIKANAYAEMQQISGNQTYKFRLSFSTNDDVNTRRAVGNNEDPGYFTGYELAFPEDKYKYNDDMTDLIPGSDGLADIWQPLTENRASNDGYFYSSYPKKNPLTGYYEGGLNASGADNPWGTQRRTITHGSNGFRYRASYKYEGKGTWTNRYHNGEFTHEFKSGFEGSLAELHYSSNSGPYDGNAFRDIYTDKEEWGGNFYTDDKTILDRTQKPYRPIKGSAFFEDQISYKGIVMTLGLRADYFDANTMYRLTEKSPRYIPITAPDSMFADSEVKFQLSPRLNVKYPVTESSMIGISYGLFHQVPKYYYMYDNFGAEQIRSGAAIGNPNMDAQRMNKYQVTYTQLIGNMFQIKGAVFYEDVYQQLGMQQVATVPDPYYRYSVNEYGNSRGVEIELEKSPYKDHLGFDMNYTLSWVKGTAEGPGSNDGRPVDPYTGKITFPLAEYPFRGKVRHRLSGSVYLQWRDNDGPSIAGIQPLENTSISIMGTARSGYPYTVTDYNGNELGEKNANYQPSYWRLDARVSKTFRLKDWFGKDSKMSSASIELYVMMYNITNRRAMTAFYTGTGDPIDDGRSLSRQIGDFSSTAIYAKANPENYKTYSASQYDNYGNRLYNEAGDFNQDGVITQQEKYQSYINFVELSWKYLGNFMSPFSMNGGINFRF